MENNPPRVNVPVLLSEQKEHRYFSLAASPGFFLTFHAKPIEGPSPLIDALAVRVIEGVFIAHVVLAATETLIERLTGAALERVMTPRGEPPQKDSAYPEVEAARRAAQRRQMDTVAMNRKRNMQTIEFIATPWANAPPHRLLFETHGVRFCLRSPAHMSRVLTELEWIIHDAVNPDGRLPIAYEREAWWSAEGDPRLLKYIIDVWSFATHIHRRAALNRDDAFDASEPGSDIVLMPKMGELLKAPPFTPPLNQPRQWMWTSQPMAYHSRNRFKAWVYSIRPSLIYQRLHEMYPSSGWEKF